MDSTLIAFLFGILGGVVKAGFLTLDLYRLKRIGGSGYLITMIFLILAGGLGGILFNIGWVFSILGGYGASELLESLAKIFKRGKVKFE